MPRERSKGSIDYHNRQKERAQQTRLKIVELRSEGKRRKEICTILGMSPSAVSHHLKASVDEWRKERGDLLTEWARAMLTKYSLMLDDVLVEWERSKKPFESRTVEVAGKDEHGNPKKKIIYRKEGQTGNPALFDKALSIMESIRKIIGIDAATRTEIGGGGGGPILLASVNELNDEQLAAQIAERRDRLARLRGGGVEEGCTQEPNAICVVGERPLPAVVASPEAGGETRPDGNG